MLNTTNSRLILGAIAAIALLIIPFTFVRAIGITALPSEITITVSRGENTTAHLTVQNPSREVAIFEVYPDDLDTMIIPIPSRFTLESAETRVIEIKLIPKQEGVFTTNLSVLARPITDPLLGIGSGLKIPINITVTAPRTMSLASIISLSSPLGIIVALLATLAVCIYAFHRALKKRTAERY
ncbi:MAG: hypothetical protein NUV53_01930 [Patescibacteria group bacterium]|nr:hypothetical protein [Patescibacteria group bacterium]